MPAYPNSQNDPIYQKVGCNNRGHLVQSKRLLPFHEDITKVTPFDNATVAPGQWATVKLDLKHAQDRELILNDIRLQFQLDFRASRTNVGQVYAVRGTDLIREMIVKINEDIVFKVDKRGELTHLWLMGNHKADGDSMAARQGFLLNYGNIPTGDAPPLYYDSTTKGWFTKQVVSGTPPVTTYSDDAAWTHARRTNTSFTRHDGRPRLIFDDNVGSGLPTYVHTFDISLNQICGAIFTRLHLRRIEYITLEVRFEPFISQVDTQEFLLFKTNPVASGLIHPYNTSAPIFTNLAVRQYRTTVLDGTGGFSLPDSYMLSWLLRRYSMREISFDFSNSTSLEIKLSNWEIRTNITRLYWQVKPTVANRNGENKFVPLFPPNNFESLFAVELWWKNDKVLDLDTTFQVYRHYTLAENKRYGLMNPFIRFYKLEPPYKNGKADGQVVNYNWDAIDTTNAMSPDGSSVSSDANPLYEAGLYFVDLHMNVLPGVAGSDIIDGIVNDTSDYRLILKRPTDRSSFVNSGLQTIQVWLEYQTLVNLAANSNQFSRGSQVVTKQLNMQ